LQRENFKILPRDIFEIKSDLRQPYRIFPEPVFPTAVWIAQALKEPWLKHLHWGD
jgi:hypothetical protein